VEYQGLLSIYHMVISVNFSGDQCKQTLIVFASDRLVDLKSLGSKAGMNDIQSLKAFIMNFSLSSG
jgi:hypothetical protein